ncbi:MAG: hypothetical protein ACP5VF_07435 [Acidobacteriota bacterium]
MRCEEFLRVMDEDGPVQSGDAGAHLASCQACRRAFEEFLSVRRELRAMSEGETPADLHGLIMARVRAEPESGSRRAGRFRWFRAAWAGPIAAVVLFAVLGGWAVLHELHPFRKVPPPLARPSPQGEAKAEAPREAATNLGRPSRGMNEARPPEATPAAHPAEPPGAEFGAPVPLEGGPFPAAGEFRRSEPSGTEGPLAQSAPEGSTAPHNPTPLEQEEDAAQGTFYVLCSLQSEDNGSPIVVSLPSTAAPPSNARWWVVVKRNGGIQITDARGQALADPQGGIESVLAPLHPPPGRYRLQRANG